MSIVKSQGTKITVSADGTTFKTVGHVKSFSGVGGGSATVIDTTHLLSVAKEKALGLQDFGEVSLELNYVPADEGQVILKTAQENQSEIDVKIELPDGTTSGTTWAFKAYVSTFPKGGGVDDIITGSVTMPISGAVIETAAS